MPLTIRLNKILIFARDEAERLQNTSVEPEHLLLGLLRLAEGEAFALLEKAELPLDSLKNQLDQLLQQPAATTIQNISRSSQTESIIRIAEGISREYQQEVVGSVHLLLAILRHRINRASLLLADWDITYERMVKLYARPHTQIQPTAGNGLDSNISDGTPQYESRTKTKIGTTTSLDKYGHDLSKMAREQKLDPVVGREIEIERVIQILSRRKKNNPILIGEPGVGKSAIVEGLALRIQEGSAVALQGKRIIALDIASMVAGTTYRGQFEERMKSVIQELNTHPEIILFIDEIHTIIGAGNAQGSLDAANILKPALARGEVQCIGATTINEYKTSIEKDGALERRFQKVIVRPTTKQETLDILNRLSEHYATYHHVVYTPECLKAIVELSERYLTERAFPDKAIDVMDEAGARAHAKQKALGESVQNEPTHLTTDDIASVVSMMSSVPVQRVQTTENEHLRKMSDVLLERVIGQDEAVRTVVKAIQRARLGLHDPRRPIGTFFFLGPTGVGKTYLAQCLAEEMFGSRDAVIRFDMSEYMEKHTVSLLVGAPPGYEAHTEGGKLTESVRRKPYSVVLFDEIEKAHPDVFNILLQVMDEGRLTDRQGNEVNFRNTIIILTSNVGTRHLKDFGSGIGFDAEQRSNEVIKRTLLNALKKTFPPEFVNRIDNIITFQPLTRDALARIIDIEVDLLGRRLRANGHQLELTDMARTQLLDLAYDPDNGARPIRRAMQTYVEDTLTDILLAHPTRKRIVLKQLDKQHNP